MKNKIYIFEVIKRLSFTAIMALITIIDVKLNTLRPNTQNIKIGLDNLIPFNKYFIFPYVYWFLYVAAGLIILAVINKKNYFRLLSSLIIGMLICYIIYFIYPSTVLRPAIVSNDFVSQIVKFIYKVDNPYNCFPSIHVLNSFFISIYLIKSIKNRKIHVIFYFSFIIITLSTLFVKQHYVLDAASATILGIVIYALVMFFTRDRQSVIVNNDNNIKNISKKKYEAET